MYVTGDQLSDSSDAFLEQNIFYDKMAGDFF